MAKRTALTTAKPKNDAASWLHHALTTAQMAVFEWDIPSGSIHWAENAGEVLGINNMQCLANAQQFEAMVAEATLTTIQANRFQFVRGGKKTAKPLHGGHYECEYNLRLGDGQNIYVHERGTRVLDAKGNISRIIGTLTPKIISEMDVTNALLIQSALEEAYHYPPVFMQALQQALHKTMKSKAKSGALIIVSIDNMPMIISGYGHSSAEQIMLEVESELESYLDKQDQIFRIQRDQFALILPKASLEDAQAKSKQLSRSLKQFGLKASIQPLHIVPSCGYAMFHEMESEFSSTALDVIDRAYVVLKSHNSLVPGITEEATENRSTSIKQMEMATYVHAAIHSDRLQLAYQPVIQSTTGKIAHYECLLRLRGDDGQISSAGALIPVAERMGLINIIDQLVLEMVVEDMLRDSDVSLAFNISNLTTNDSEWLDTFTRVLEATPEIAPRMIIEITETAAQRDLGETAYFVAAVQAMGCRVALDDFGSGYTSFRQLKGLSCDMVKIDGSFIKELPGNADNRFFVKTLLDFTQGFGLEAVAEMVENGETAKILMDLGVEYMQGYYFGKPANERVWLKQL